MFHLNVWLLQPVVVKKVKIYIKLNDDHEKYGLSYMVVFFLNIKLIILCGRVNIVIWIIIIARKTIPLSYFLFI